MYFVLELQKLDSTRNAILTYHEDNWTFQQAQSVFFGKCQYAAISAIPEHTIMLVDVEGSVYETKVFMHEQPTNPAEV